MSEITRIYVEKKPGFDIEGAKPVGRFALYIGLEGLSGVRIFKRYDVAGLSGNDLERAERIVCLGA